MGKGVQASLCIAAFAMLILPMVHASPAAIDTTILTIPPSVDPTTGAIGTRGGYAPIAVVADVAGTLTITNADLTAHDIVSVAPGPADNAWCARFVVGHGYCPLFASPLVGLGRSAVVQGTEQLVPGATYPFFCSVHHWMEGTLVAI